MSKTQAEKDLEFEKKLDEDPKLVDELLKLVGAVAEITFREDLKQVRINLDENPSSKAYVILRSSPDEEIEFEWRKEMWIHQAQMKDSHRRLWDLSGGGYL